MNNLSTYECPHCLAREQAAPATKRRCTRCNVVMKEVVKGIVTREGGNQAPNPPAPAPAGSQASEPPKGPSPEELQTMPYDNLKALAKELKIPSYGILKEEKLRDEIYVKLFGARQADDTQA